MTDILHAIFLGILEGLTEFLPVSSTGHLILFTDLLGFTVPANKVFDIVIQLGAILAVCVVYWQRLWNVAVTLPSSKTSQRFLLNIILAFIPAMVLGALFHDYIKAVLFNPTVVCIALIVGGIAILVLETVLTKPRLTDIDAVTPATSFKIGLLQCLAMIPGVSRSGATIMGGLALGLDRRTAAEFSFFLAIPTMAAATAFDLYKNMHDLTADGLGMIAIGFVTAFISALFVVRWMIGFVTTHGFKPFAIYRIILGVVMLGLIYC